MNRAAYLLGTTITQSTTQEDTFREQNVSQSFIDSFLHPLHAILGRQDAASSLDADMVSSSSSSSSFLQVLPSASSLVSSPPGVDADAAWLRGLDYAAPEASTSSSLLFYRAWNFTWDYRNWSYGNLSDEDYLLLSGDEGPSPALSTPRAVITAMILCLICLMTISGNILVLVAVFVNSHLRGTTHYFIANLAVADLLLGTIVLPFSATLEVAAGHWYFGQFFCDVWAAVDVLCCTASIMSLCVISIDRYIGVTRPLQHSTIMSERRAGYIILLVWILSMTISIAPLLGWKEPPPDNPSVCLVTQELGYVLFSVSGSFYIPLIIILVVYFRVYREALSQSRFLATGVKKSKSDEHKEITLRIHTGRASSMPSPNLNSTSPNYHKKSVASPSYQSSSSSEHSQGSGKKNHKLTLAGKIAKFNREKKAAKTLGIVVGVFILCWFPFFFFLPLGAVCEKCQPPEWFFKVIFWLGYCNSTMNPVIYAMSSREFKRAFIRILKCQCRHRPRSFVWENASSPTTTEMNKLYSSMRRFTKREVPSFAVNNRRVHGAPFFNRNNQTNYGDTLQVSMQLLHEKQRKETAETMIISDDESAIIEQSDDEKSDMENGSVIVSFPRSTDESEENKRLMEHKGLWEEEEEDEDEGEKGEEEKEEEQDEEFVRLPGDVVINCEDAEVTEPCFLVNGPVDSYPLQDNQIMWL